MPQVIPVVVAAIGATGAVGFGVQLLSISFLSSFAVPLVLSGISSVLTKKPKFSAPDFSSLAQDRVVTVRQPAASRQIVLGRARVGGNIVFAESTGDNEYLHLVIALAGHECQEIEEVWFDDETVPLSSGAATGKYAGYAWVYKHLGTSSQTADSNLVSDVAQWTTNHRLRGVTYVYVKLKSNRNLFPNGVPNVTAVVKGVKCLDPRNSPQTTAWTDNPALLLNWYLTDTTYGLGATYADEIDETDLIAAANECEESVTLADATTEERYTCNGTIDSGESPENIIKSLTSAMAGKVIWSEGTWHINAGAYTAPSVTLDESDIRGPIRVTTRLTRSELFNRVKGVYVSEDNNWQPADFAPVTNSTYVTEDNGEIIWRDIDLQFTTSAPTAQRLAKIALEKARQQISVSLQCKLTAMQLTVGDTVSLTVDRFGWSSKVFEVLDWKLVQYEEDDTPALGVDLELRETASTVYDWNSGEETSVDPAPNTNLPDPFDVSAPTSLSVSSVQITTSAGDETYLATVSWALHSNAFVRNGGRIEVQWKPSADNEYRPSWTVEGDETEAKINQLERGVNYDVRVRAINYLGSKSDWSTYTGFTVTSPAGATSSLDYGEFSDSVTTNLDYGAFSDSVSTNLDYGEFS